MAGDATIRRMLTCIVINMAISAIVTACVECEFAHHIPLKHVLPIGKPRTIATVAAVE